MMLTLDECREILGETASDLPDREIAGLRELAEIIVEMFVEKKRGGA